MAKFQILRLLEHNQVLYVPKGTAEVVKTKSAGNGSEIPVDASGTIELDAAEAGALTSGQIAPLAAENVEGSAPRRSKR